MRARPVTRHLALPVLLFILAIPGTGYGQVEDLTREAGSLSALIGTALESAGRMQQDDRFSIAFRFDGLVPSDAHAGGGGSMVITRSDGWMMTGLGGIVSLADPWGRPGAGEQVLDLATMTMTAPDPDPVLEQRRLLCFLHGRAAGREGTKISGLSIRLAEGRMGMHERRLLWLGSAATREVTTWIGDQMASLDPRRDSGLREDLVGLLSLMPEGNDVVSMLAQYASEDEDEDVRHRAISWLGNRPENTSPRLASIFAGAEEPGDRARVLRAIAGREGPASRELLTLTVLDGDESEVVRVTALAYLNRFEDREMDALLEDLLSDPEVGIRRRVVSLWEERDARRAVPLLERVALNDSERRVQEAAVSSLGDITDTSAAQALGRIFDHSEDERVRMVALRQRLEKMDADSERITWLEKLARGDASFEVRKEAVRQLGRIEDPAARQALRRLLDVGR